MYLRKIASLGCTLALLFSFAALADTKKGGKAPYEIGPNGEHWVKVETVKDGKVVVERVDISADLNDLAGYDEGLTKADEPLPSPHEFFQEHRAMRRLFVGSRQAADGRLLDPMQTFVPMMRGIFSPSQPSASYISNGLITSGPAIRFEGFEPTLMCTKESQILVGVKTSACEGQEDWLGEEESKRLMSGIGRAYNSLSSGPDRRANAENRRLFFLAFMACTAFKETGGMWGSNPFAPEKWKEGKTVGMFQFNPNQVNSETTKNKAGEEKKEIFTNSGNLVTCDEDWKRDATLLERFEPLAKDHSSQNFRARGESELRKQLVTSPTQSFSYFCGGKKLLGNLSCQQNRMKNLGCVSPFNDCYNHYGSHMCASKGFLKCMTGEFLKEQKTDDPKKSQWTVNLPKIRYWLGRHGDRFPEMVMEERPLGVPPVRHLPKGEEDGNPRPLGQPPVRNPEPPVVFPRPIPLGV